MITQRAFNSSVLEKQRAEHKQHLTKKIIRVPCYEMIRLTQLHSAGCRDDNQDDRQC